MGRNRVGLYLRKDLCEVWRLMIVSAAREFLSNEKMWAGRKGFEEKEEAIQVVDDALR